MKISYTIISFILLITLFAIIGCGGGGSSDDSTDSSYEFSSEVGIWKGTLTSNTTPETYDVTMVFHLPDGASEGRVMGTAFKQGSLNPADHFLLDSGYEYAPDFGYDFDLIVGTHGSQGSFLKEFDYEYGSQHEKDQRGKIEINVSGQTMTGTAYFQEFGEMTLFANYAADNGMASTLNDLHSYGTDAATEHRWTNDNTGGQMTITNLDTGTFSVLQASLPSPPCRGSGQISDVADQNIFTFDSVQAENCNIQPPADIGDPGYPDVDGDPSKDYDGLGILVQKNGSMVFQTFMSKESVMLYNEWY
jgi:hypothetical protein